MRVSAAPTTAAAHYDSVLHGTNTTIFESCRLFDTLKGRSKFLKIFPKREAESEVEAEAEAEADCGIENKSPVVEVDFFLTTTNTTTTTHAMYLLYFDTSDILFKKGETNFFERRFYFFT